MTKSNKRTSAKNGTKITSFADGMKYAAKQIASIKLLTVFRVALFLMVFILLVFSVNVATNKSAVEKLLTHVIEKDKQEKINMNIRDMVSPKIQRNLIDLIYTLDCDRAFIIEFHNGKKNATDLPFKYFDMTYEEVNENYYVKHISQHFTNVMITHYKLPYYLSKETMFIGDTDELGKIDRRFCDNFMEYQGYYLAIIMLRSNKDEIGFLGIAYNNKDRVKPKKEIEYVINTKAKTMKDLIDLGVQRLYIEYDKEGNIIEG
jgi:hypothetical protein